METLAVALLLFLLGNFWVIGGWLLKKAYDHDGKLRRQCEDAEKRDKRIQNIEETVDDHEGRLHNLEEPEVTGA